MSREDRAESSSIGTLSPTPWSLLLTLGQMTTSTNQDRGVYCSGGRARAPAPLVGWRPLLDQLVSSGASTWCAAPSPEPAR